MKIDLQVIPHKSQRYETIGDYWWEGEDLYIRVSDLGNERMNWLVGIHEYVEAMLCKFHMIAEPLCMAFDKHFEAKRLSDRGVDYDEPGNDPLAPYYKQHQMATIVEGLMANELNVDWEKYGKIVDSL